jgi:hypothetical protein
LDFAAKEKVTVKSAAGELELPQAANDNGFSAGTLSTALLLKLRNNHH